MAYLYEKASSQVDLFFRLAHKYRDDVFLCGKYKNGEPCDEWVPITYLQAAKEARCLGAGLIYNGIEKDERIGIFSQNRPRWVIADQAIQGAGGIGVPIYPTSTNEQLKFILKDCKASAVIVGDQMLLDQVLSVKKALPDLRFIVSMTPSAGKDDPTILQWHKLVTIGKRQKKTLYQFDRRRKALTQTDMASIIYTSGTTGNPKGVVLTQGNFKAETSMVLGAPVTQKILERDIRLTSLCHLPLCHVMGRASDYHAQMALGSTIYFAESMQTVQEDILVVRPQVMASIPRLYEKIYEGVQSYAEELTGMKSRVFGWSMKVGDRAADCMIRGQKLPFALSVKFALANILVYQHIRKFTGLDRLASAISGGGALAPEIVRFFRSMNLIIAEGYGLTETTSAIAWNGPRFQEPLPDTWFHNRTFEWLVDTMVEMQSRGKSPFTSLTGFLKIAVFSKVVLPRMLIKPGYVGRPLPGTEIKLAEDNEILVKGPSVFNQEHGYFNQPEKTAEVFTEDGFFKTGDVGEFDEDGFLRITDRKKEILVTSGGKNVAPQPMELALIVDHCIDQVCVVGDGKKYLAALIVPHFPSINAFAQRRGITFHDYTDLVENEEILAYFEARITAINIKFARYEQIKRFCLLPAPFSVETGELTPTLKMKRRVIYEKYAKEIELLYK
ncbi:MAG: long-chain fatty acid--CoA ligase [Thermodesulfobacteriota bacterium]|nr:long-chain fatty acid--CoA ligase [Thermodesulfobacteriota bacterium]